jgi:predicted small integral membrane protein
VRRLGSFAYDFVVGDDPVVAVLVVVAIAGAWLLQRSGVNAWWGVPAVVVAALALSIRRAARPQG